MLFFLMWWVIVPQERYHSAAFCGVAHRREKEIMALTPIRRVVTGNDAQGRSKVVWDGPSPGTHESKFTGRGHTDFWVWRETPPGLDGAEDAGTWDDEFPGPVGGGHLRVVHWLAKTAESPPHDPYKAPEAHAR